VEWVEKERALFRGYSRKEQRGGKGVLLRGKTAMSNENMEIFDKEFWIDLGSDFTMPSLRHCMEQIAKGRCLMINDGTLLFSSKSERTKQRIINGLSELTADGKYVYRDFGRKNKFTLQGKATVIMNIVPESFQNYKNRLFGLTFSERFQILHHASTKAEREAGVKKEELAKKILISALKVNNKILLCWRLDFIQNYDCIYWFRDYWSNRQEMNRNQKSEKFGWKTDENFDFESLGKGELHVQKDVDGRSSIIGNTGNTLFSGLKDPHSLIEQYEPKNINVIQSLYVRGFEKTPQDYYYTSNIVAPGSSSYAELPRMVKAEPVNNMRSGLKRLSLGNPLLIFPIQLLLAWLVLEFSPTLPLLYRIAVFLFGTFLIIKIGVPRLKHPVGYAFGFLFLWLFIEYVYIYFPIKLVVIYFLVYPFITAVIDELGIDVLDANSTIFLYDGEKPETHYKNIKDAPPWLDSKPYWVMRYRFRWRGEFTLKKQLQMFHFKKDWERVEVWIDARSGIVEWIVSDYHWRELWFESEKGLNAIYVWIYPNFHTPRPLTLKIAESELIELYDRSSPLFKRWKKYVLDITGYFSERNKKAFYRSKRLRSIFFTMYSISKLSKKSFQRKQRLHKIIEKIISPIGFLLGISSSDKFIVTRTISQIWWSKWRYPLGANNCSYKDKDVHGINIQPIFQKQEDWSS
jgi:hypothetical protein